MNNNENIKDINQILKMIEMAFESGKEQEFFNILIPYQKKHSLNFSAKDLGLLLLSKKSCISLADLYENSGLYNQAQVIYEFVLKYFPEDDELVKKYTASQLKFTKENV